MITILSGAVEHLRQRWRVIRRNDDTGATAIEWAIFALLALAIAGIVAGAITIAVKTRSANIQ
jgi:hypothetical protein